MGFLVYQQQAVVVEVVLLQYSQADLVQFGLLVVVMVVQELSSLNGHK
jgi:hypothetical protein